MSGNWVVHIDDVELPGSEWLYIVSALSTLGIIIVTDVEADTTAFTNNSDQVYRLSFELVDGSPVSIAESNTNPTLVINEISNVVTFCLAAAM